MNATELADGVVAQGLAIKYQGGYALHGKGLTTKADEFIRDGRVVLAMLRLVKIEGRWYKFFRSLMNQAEKSDENFLDLLADAPAIIEACLQALGGSDDT